MTNAWVRTTAKRRPKQSAGLPERMLIMHPARGGMMFRTILIGAAAAGALLSATPTTALAQPPTPPQIVHKIDRHVRRAVTGTHRAVRRAAHRTDHTVHHAARVSTRHRVRALCNDGRVHFGRTRRTACAAHGGLRR
jgi:hypothetical protein